MWAMMAPSPRKPDPDRSVRLRWRRSVAALVALVLLMGVLVLGTSTARGGALPAGWPEPGGTAWAPVPTPILMAPEGASTLRLTTTIRGVRVAFSRVIIDRVEARLAADPIAGVRLSARARIVDLTPLEVVVEANWRGPCVLATSWWLGPLGIRLTRELSNSGAVSAQLAWAISDRLLVGAGWMTREAAGLAAEQAWLVWAEILAPRRWMGWTVWIGIGEAGISWYRAWAG